MLVSKGALNGKDAHIPYGTGCANNYISEAFWEKQHIPWGRVNGYTAVMAINAEKKVGCTTDTIVPSIGTYSVSMRFFASPLFFDLILGKIAHKTQSYY